VPSPEAKPTEQVEQPTQQPAEPTSTPTTAPIIEVTVSPVVEEPATCNGTGDCSPCEVIEMALASGKIVVIVDSEHMSVVDDSALLLMADGHESQLNRSARR